MTEIDKSILINTNIPRDSRVYRDGDYVVKMPVATNNAHVKVWFERQKHAKNTVDRILEKQEKDSYFIPKTIKMSESPKTFVQEELVSGKPLTVEYFSGLTQQQKEIIYHSLADFISDMNEILPVLDILSQLQTTNNNELSFFEVLKRLKPILSAKEYTIVNNAYDLLEKQSGKTPSLVFFHGDMNENNIFFDEMTNKVSIIDFTESKYESAYYMFHSDLSRLPWLDINKLIEIYKNIPRKNQVRVDQDKTMIDIFNYLRTIQHTGNSLLTATKNVAIYERILKETILSLQKIYNNAVNSVYLINTVSNLR